MLYENRLYKPLPQHFFFSKEISRGRKYEVENWLKDNMPQLETTIEMLEQELEVLDDIAEELKRGNHIEHLAEQNKSVTFPSGNKYQIAKQTVDAPFVPGMSAPGDVIELIELIIQDNHGKRLKRAVFDEPYPDIEFKWYLLRRRDEFLRCREELTSYQQILETIEDDSPAVWSYWDFFYFSVSTQTTLGYGDILPNSSLVRRLVIVQVFSGLAILVLLINFVILLFQP